LSTRRLVRSPALWRQPTPTPSCSSRPLKYRPSSPGPPSRIQIPNPSVVP
jgi:hypothetical protein